MKKKDIKYQYECYMQEAVDEYLRKDGRSTAMYQYFRGRVLSYGDVLGYKHDKVWEELNNAILETEKKLYREALNLKEGAI